MDSLWQDIRFGCRVLFRRPLWTLVAVITLAAGIGPTTAVFSIINAYLYRPLPVAEPNRIVRLYYPLKKYLHENPYHNPFPYPGFRFIREHNEVFTDVVAYSYTAVHLSTGETTERVHGELVSGNYFPMLGIRPVLGRLLMPPDDRPDALPVAVIHESLWDRLFHRDPGIIGRSVRLNRQTFTLVGVVPNQFKGIRIRGTSPQIWIPLALDPVLTGSKRLQRMDYIWLTVAARLKPGITLEQARAHLQVLARRLADEYSSARGHTLTLLPEREARLSPGSLRRMFTRLTTLLMLVVGILLLIASLNVVNLMLARATARRHEMHVRLSVGASPLRLGRQGLVETLLLYLLGAGLGLLFASWVTDFFRHTATGPLTTGLELYMDHRVLGFAVAVSLVTGVLFGMIPAIHAARTQPIVGLRDIAAGRSIHRSRLRKSLVALQVALSLMAIIAAGLSIRSLRNLLATDPGYPIRNVLTLSFDLALQRYSQNEMQAFYRDVLERLHNLPGIEAATLSTFTPLAPGLMKGPAQARHRSGSVTAEYQFIGPGFFRTLHIPILRGREFGPRDTKDAPAVAIINETLAQRLYPGQDPIGKGLRTAFGAETTIIGVVPDIKLHTPRDTPDPVVYLPIFQLNFGYATLLVRTRDEPMQSLPDIRGVFRDLDADLPLYDIRTLAQRMEESVALERTISRLLNLFGLLGLLLAASGVYSVVAYTTTQRFSEFGVRLALGATPRNLVRLVLMEGLKIGMLGLVLGIVGTILVARSYAGLLYRVPPVDPLTYGAVCILLLAVVALASMFPARRAAHVNPVEVLQRE